MSSEIVFNAAFGNVDKQVRMFYLSGVVHPTYIVSINGKEVGRVRYVKLTLGGRPEVWRCEFEDKFTTLFTPDDCQELIAIASEHYENHINKTSSF
ncbi:hypothetical protein [Pedobacter sp. SL55]|uniref:hypothetical protein n=1 Tax=Pedobacter sp. SL55 TaxID=2995161 RepID=UPI00226DDE70|nr:hypothetical protein [Pedobacter sp. SL55]WAC40562.1 hypothetical protein OVA16_18655 [Pedobacter sp. SL55]